MALIQTFVPIYRAADGTALRHIMQAMAHASAAGHQIIASSYGGALVDDARNSALGQCLSNVDYLLFIDDDMKPEPDAINKIVALDRPITSALCTTRSEPVALSLSEWEEKEHRFKKWESYAPTRIIEGQYGVGAAFLCVRMDALMQLVDYYLTARDWLAWNRPLLDRLKVRSEFREQERERKESLRRMFMQKRGLLRIFERMVYDSELNVGEDLAFCWKAIQCGIPITVDPTIRVGHKGDKDYHVEDYIAPEHVKNFIHTPESLGIKELIA